MSTDARKLVRWLVLCLGILLSGAGLYRSFYFGWAATTPSVHQDAYKATSDYYLYGSLMTLVVAAIAFRAMRRWARKD